jgi:tRNA pseudouridine38-40 synthase
MIEYTEAQPITDAQAPSRNLRLLLAYDGTEFHGWQRQPNLATLQLCLEEAIAGIVGERVKLYGSGRTDAGVHALGQVANFSTSCRIPGANLQKALNNVLPPTVRVRRVDEAAPDFHARYAVRSKTYRYRILRSEVCSPFLWRYVWHHPHTLDRELMAEAAELLIGEHDFTSFAATTSGDEDDLEPSMVRRIFSSRVLWRERSGVLAYDVTGNGFLHHMVRNLVGTLVEVGRGRLKPNDVGRILRVRDRTLAGPTAPAQGLCLMRVEY